MKKRLRINSRILLIVLIGVFALAGCFEPTEGCLDSNATNFEVLADENCCCVYPSITVGLFHVVGDVDHHIDSIYTNDLGQKYRVPAQSFYIGQMGVQYIDGSNSNVIDTLELEIPLSSGNDVILEDNYALVKHTSPAFSPGMIKENGSIEEVHFNIGLDNDASQLLPAQLESRHPLGTSGSADHYIESQGYLDMIWNIIPIDVVGADTLNLSFTDVFRNVSIPVDPIIISEPGSNTAIPLEIDFGQWLEGIDFAGDIEQIKAGIIANAGKSFSIR